MLLVGAIVLCITAILIGFILRKNSVRLKKKDTEILYRDEMFQKLSMNVDDVFLMLDAKTYQADYVSPNVEKLLGITVEQIQKDSCVLRERRHIRVRTKISGTPERPRLCVYRSNKNLFVQIIDDVNGVTLAEASTLNKEAQ